MNTILQVNQVSKTYRGGGSKVRAVHEVSFSVEAGRLVAIMGASGSGKSTLLHLIGGLDVPDAGSVLIDGQDITRMSDRRRTLFRRRKMGIIFQTFNLLPTLTAGENIAVPLLVDGVSGTAIRPKLEEMVRLVHLEQRMNHRPQAMSGGEQQRVAIARALLNDPALVLADEPTGNLDSISAAEIWRLLAKLARELGKTVLMVTHEPAAAAQADRIYVLKDGSIIGTIDEVNGDAALVAARYTQLAG